MRALILTLFLPTAAMAECINDTEVFSCEIGEKTLLVCHWKGALIYSFGTANAPDLTIAEPLETVDFTPWPGVGSAIWESVAFHNQNYTYEVWTAVERNPEDTAGVQGGVNVLKGEALQAQLTCNPGSPSQSLDVIYELKESIGQCWDFDQDRWTTLCN
jgi:hypothetical protein